MLDWLALRNAGRDALSAQLWTAPATVHTVMPSATVVLGSPSSIERFWAQRGCIFTPAGPISVQGAVVTLRLLRGGTRPTSTAGPCTETGARFRAAATVSGARVRRLIETNAP